MSWTGRKASPQRLSFAEMSGMKERNERLIVDLDAPQEALNDIFRLASETGVELWGWIEIARDVEAAAAHPEWMHAPQHHEWLDAFPDWRPGGGKHPALVFPWVCVNNRETFDYELARVVDLVSKAPPLSGLFLNDIQGAPAGCGCGNILCRSWDNSPGEKIAPTPYSNPDVFFSKAFWLACKSALSALSEKSISPGNLIPILCGECELGVQIGEVFSPDDLLGGCRGIPCAGVCAHSYWPGMVRAFAQTEGGPETIGLLTPYKLFGRDSPIYGESAGWVAGLTQHYLEFDSAAHIIAVVQGWDVTEAQIEAQIGMAKKGGATGTLVIETKLDQSWEPAHPPADYVPTVPPSMCKH